MSLLGISKEAESDHEGFQPTSSLYGRPIPERTNRGRVGDEHEVVCAISESGNAKVFGVATIDLTIGQANITKVVGEDGYKTVVETLWRMEHRPQTFLVLKKQFPDALLLPVDREFWRESTGLRLIRRYAYRADEPPLRASLENNFYASCAWSAAMSWVEKHAPVKFFRHGVHVVYSPPADTMGLDRAAVSALELLQNARGGRAGPTTLFGVLNHTLTPQGRRLLRSTILQPSTDEDLLTQRWNAVEELCSHQEFFNDVRAGLQKLQRIDVEQIMSQMGKQLQKPRQEIVSELTYHPGGTAEIIMASHEVLQGAEKDLNRILMIKAYAQGVQALHETLEAVGCSSYLCGRATRKSGPRYTMPILNLINKYIQDDAVFSKRPVDIRNNRLWAVKEDTDSLMAKSRQEYRRHTSELQEWYEYLGGYFEKHLGCRPKLVFSTDNHYRLQFLWTDVEKGVNKEMKRTGLRLPRIKLLAGEDIAFAERKNKQFFCTTKELIILSGRIQAQADVVTQQSDRVVMELKRALLDQFSRLHMTAEAVATLDMLCSFAQVTTSQNYIRPKIAKSLVLMGARHPVVEIRKKDYVANDIFSGDEELRCTIVTGSNMSGKSTYVRSVALIQILAQIGCFVPATQADMSICDRIFTRLSTEDKPQHNLGTFAVEMTEMSAIMYQATKSSMVIIDELGRGTSTVDGIALASAMCEELVEKKGPRMFFATHFPEIGDFMNEHYREQVLNVHLAAPRDSTTLPHKMVNGPVRDRDYGINLARPYLPETVIRNAQTLSRHLESLRGGAGATDPRPATKEEKIERLFGAVTPIIRQAIDSPMDNEALGRYVSNLQDELQYNEQAEDHQLSGSRPSVRPKPPVLEDIPESERQRWSARCRAAEERTMKNNRKYFRKNKAVAESDQEARKRKERDTDDGLVADGGLAEEEMEGKRMRREKREARERNKRFKRSPDENPPSQANVEELKNWYLERARRVGG
ncbi:hypothetical protein QBC43DRAFT_256213 [Cladorrhinum sp. PSN259]|nr:hypothetical protein QBC43DRAFT_256213 [Cladorrhinum sp. PSN259]